MSTSRGNPTRSRPQKHQNRTAFKNDLHDTSKRTKFINNLQVSGVCNKCKDIIDWKIKYKKYKPLSAPAKCVGCGQKTVKYAYHVLCGKCAVARKVCAKCNKAIDVHEKEQVENDDTKFNLQSILKALPERKRRTLLRDIKKEGTEENLTPELISNIRNIMAQMDDIDLDEDLFENSDDNDVDQE